MRVEHSGQAPTIDPGATVAASAVVSGDVRLGAGCRVLHGAVLTAESGPVTLGRNVIVMEHAVIRGTARHPVEIGNHVLVGPQSHLTGCTIAEGVFIATGAAIFNGAVLEEGVEVRIGGVVHVKSRLPVGTVVPIGWVAVGDPAEVLPPEAHDRIWALQAPLDFPRTVFGLNRDDPVTLTRRLTGRYSVALAAHEGDRILD